MAGAGSHALDLPDGLVATEVGLFALDQTLWRVVRPSERVPAGRLFRIDSDQPGHHHMGFVCHPDMLEEVEDYRDRLGREEAAAVARYRTDIP